MVTVRSTKTTRSTKKARRASCCNWKKSVWFWPRRFPPIGSTDAALSYTALQARGSAAIVGVDSFVLEGELNVAINRPDTNGHVIDFAASAGLNASAFQSSDGLNVRTGPDASTDVSLIDFDRELTEVSGALNLQVDEFVTLSGEFAFSRDAAPIDATLSNGTVKNNLSLLRIGASNVDVFVGVGGPYFVDRDGVDNNDDGEIDEEGEIAPDGAIGLVLEDIEIALALLKPVVAKGPNGRPVGTPDRSSYYALSAQGGVEVVGIDAVTIRADLLTVDVNGGSDGNVATLNDPVIDFATTFAPGLDVLTGPDPDGDGPEEAPFRTLSFAGPLLQAAGDVTLIIDEFVWASGEFAFTRGNAGMVQLENGTTPAGRFQRTHDWRQRHQHFCRYRRSGFERRRHVRRR